MPQILPIMLMEQELPICMERAEQRMPAAAGMIPLPTALTTLEERIVGVMAALAVIELFTVKEG